MIESLKNQLELQREEVKTLKIKHSSKTQVFAQQSEVSVKASIKNLDSRSINFQFCYIAADSKYPDDIGEL